MYLQSTHLLLLEHLSVPLTTDSICKKS